VKRSQRHLAGAGLLAHTAAHARSQPAAHACGSAEFALAEGHQLAVVNGARLEAHLAWLAPVEESDQLIDVGGQLEDMTWMKRSADLRLRATICAAVAARLSTSASEAGPSVISARPNLLAVDSSRARSRIDFRTGRPIRPMTRSASLGVGCGQAWHARRLR
jgi:hypothetical protein